MVIVAMNPLATSMLAIWKLTKSSASQPDGRGVEGGDPQDNSVNIRRYGARGDGVTDDSAAIQAAIDHAKGCLSSLNFPEGTYLVTKRLVISGPVRLLGAGHIVASGDFDETNFEGIITVEQPGCILEGVDIEGLTIN